MLSKSVKRVLRHSDRKIYKKRLGLKRSYSFPQSPATILKLLKILKPLYRLLHNRRRKVSMPKWLGRHDDALAYIFYGVYWDIDTYIARDI